MIEFVGGRVSGDEVSFLMTYQVIVEPEDGAFVTYVPALDFASTYGPTREVALERTREMIAGYLQAAHIAGIDVPSPDHERRAELVDVAIA